MAHQIADFTDLELVLYKHGKTLWSPIFTESSDGTPYVKELNGPLCSKCKTYLRPINDTGRFYCPSCREYVELGEKLEVLSNDALAVLRSKRFQDYPVVSLDLPPGIAKSEDQSDNKYWIEARIGQKNGKKMAIVYIGEKINGKQNKDDYVQLFADIEDEQVRFDKGNKNPIKLLVRLEAEFSESKTCVERK